MLTKEWLIENWLTALSVFLYVLANVLPRPSGQQLRGPWGTFWRILDRLCFLTSVGLPGSLKPLLQPTQHRSTSKQGAVAPVEAPTQDDAARGKKKTGGKREQGI